MCLADYEQNLVDEIYNVLIYSDENVFINLYGEIGCGKSTIGLSVAKQLQEGWTVYYLKGLDSKLSPYLTWHIGTKLFSKRKLNLGGDISFGINFPPTPFSLEFGGSVQTKKDNYILTPSEEVLVECIKKQSSSNKNILFIADNYEQWDIPSKQLMQKLIMPQLNLLEDFRIAVLVITREKAVLEDNLKYNYFSIPTLSDESILFVLRQQGYSEQINLNDIRTCSGNDLSLAIMAADYYAHNDSTINSINEILDIRYNNLSQHEHEACKILEPLSIVDSCFTKDLTAYFINSTPQNDDIETDYLAEECLITAEKQLFIYGEESFRFTSETVKSFFKSQLDKRESYYHRKFANYLQKKHPEDYYNRGKHLLLSMQIHDAKINSEAWQLLLLSYMRRSSEIDNFNDVYNILDEIDLIIKRLPPDIAVSQRFVLQEFLYGYNELNKYQYRNALFHFQAITPSSLTPACLAECQRLILLCHVQLAENSKIIAQYAEELYRIIESEELFEDEQFCRAALVLLDVYTDRSNDESRVSILKNRFIKVIQDHFNCSAFQEFEAHYNRKAALYYTAAIASRQTTQSICYYRNHYNRNSLYISLCNHSGNSIVCGDYSSAKSALDECEKLLQDNKNWYYPSQYKIRNNRIILDYLTEEKNSNGNSEKIIEAAHKAALSLLKILNHQDDEISHVTLLNYLGLSMLCNENNWEKELEKANRCLTEISEYYQYYLHDLNYAAAMLHGDTAAAKHEFDILNSIEVPLLRHYRPIFQKKRLTQESILNNPNSICGCAFKYHQTIADACTHVQDSSCHFYGRGFLLSDLQFLSF